jgi:hypothetical protein
MDDLSTLISLVESVRTDQREGIRRLEASLQEVKAKQDVTNGRVNKNDTRITLLESEDRREKEGKKRWRDQVPTVVGALVGGIVLLALNFILTATILVH